jgi:hypothetical protein
VGEPALRAEVTGHQLRAGQEELALSARSLGDLAADVEDKLLAGKRRSDVDRGVLRSDGKVDASAGAIEAR